MKTNSSSRWPISARSFFPSLLKSLPMALCLLGARAEAGSVPGAPPWGSNYQLVWSQDFTTMSSLSVSANGPCGAGGTTWMATKPGGGNWFDFIPPSGNLDPFGIGSGYLDIRVQDNGASNNGFDGYTGGLLASVDNNGNGFSQQYGYFECSMWCPGTPNTWPAFWLLNVGSVNDPNLPYCAEIDVTESYGNWGTGENQSPPGQPNNDAVTWHQWGVNGNPTTSNGSYAAEAGMDTGYHTYGVDIEPTTTTWYFDRQEIWSAPTIAEADTPMFILVNLALGGGNYNNNSNPPTGYNWDLTPNPTDLKVQYIAVWASANSPNYTGSGGGGNYITAPTTATLTVGGNTWSLGSGDGNVPTLENGTQVGGGYAQVLYNPSGATVDAETTSGQWFTWNGTSWEIISPPSPLPGGGGGGGGGGNYITAPTTATLTVGGNTWSLGSGDGNVPTLENGVQVGGGYAQVLYNPSGTTVDAETASGQWFTWNGTSWEIISPPSPLPGGGGGSGPPAAYAPTGSLNINGAAWSFGTARSGSGGYPLLLNGTQAAGGIGVVLYNVSGALDVVNGGGNWYQWNGSGWTAISKPSGVPLTASLVAPTGSLTAGSDTWTFGSNDGSDYQTLENGDWVGSGYGSVYYNINGALDVAVSDGGWFQWNGSAWASIAAPTR